MNVKGKIYSGSETLPMANVYISDSKGKITIPNKGTTSDIDGNYSIDAEMSDYLTASYVGIGTKTVDISDVCSQNSCNFDFKIGGEGITLPEFTVMAKSGKVDWKKIALISGISILSITVVYFGIKYFKK